MILTGPVLPLPSSNSSPEEDDMILTGPVLPLPSSNSSPEEVPSIRIIIHHGWPCRPTLQSGHHQGPHSKPVLHKLLPQPLVPPLLRCSTLSKPLVRIILALPVILHQAGVLQCQVPPLAAILPGAHHPGTVSP